MPGADKIHGEEQWGGYFFFPWRSTEHSQGKTILESTRDLNDLQEQIRTLQGDDGMSVPGVGRHWAEFGLIQWK